VKARSVEHEATSRISKNAFDYLCRQPSVIRDIEHDLRYRAPLFLQSFWRRGNDAAHAGNERLDLDSLRPARIWPVFTSLFGLAWLNIIGWVD
jgi:hypothetical protein